MEQGIFLDLYRVAGPKLREVMEEAWVKGSTSDQWELWIESLPLHKLERFLSYHWHYADDGERVAFFYVTEEGRVKLVSCPLASYLGCSDDCEGYN